MAAALADPGGEADDAATVLATIADAVAAARVDELGYVSCPLPPFDKPQVWARITTFPADKPLPQRSVSCRCYLHTNCSICKKRSQVADEDLLRWAFSGQPTSTDRRREGGDAHRQLALEMFPKGGKQTSTL